MHACHTYWGLPCLLDRFHDAQAHNLEDSAREAASAKISLRALANTASEMERLGANCERLLFTINVNRVSACVCINICVINCELLLFAITVHRVRAVCLCLLSTVGCFCRQSMIIVFVLCVHVYVCCQL